MPFDSPESPPPLNITQFNDELGENYKFMSDLREDGHVRTGIGLTTEAPFDHELARVQRLSFLPHINSGYDVPSRHAQEIPEEIISQCVHEIPVPKRADAGNHTQWSTDDEQQAWYGSLLPNPNGAHYPSVSSASISTLALWNAEPYRPGPFYPNPNDYRSSSPSSSTSGIASLGSEPYCYPQLQAQHHHLVSIKGTHQRRYAVLPDVEEDDLNSYACHINIPPAYA